MKIETVHGAGVNKDKVREGIVAIPARHRELLGDLTVKNEPKVMSRYGGRAHSVAGKYTASAFPTEGGTNHWIEIADAGSGRKLKDIAGTTVHELGHALDAKHDYRLSRNMEAVISADMDKMKPEEKYLAAHFFRNAHEKFAEVYRLAYTPTKKGAFAMGQKRAEKLFARSLVAMRELKV